MSLFGNLDENIGNSMVSKGLMILLSIVVTGFILFALLFTESPIIEKIGDEYSLTYVGYSIGIITVLSIGVYFYLRSKGIGFGGFFGGITTIGIIWLGIISIIAVTDVVHNILFNLLPWIILLSIGYLLYKLKDYFNDEEQKMWYAVMIAVLVIGTPLFHLFVAPRLWGQPVELEINVTLDSEGNPVMTGSIDEPTPIRSTTTSFNPLSIYIVETARYLYEDLGRYDKYYVSFSIYDELENEVEHEEDYKEVYLMSSETTTIWFALRLDAQPEFAYKYTLWVSLYDEDFSIIEDQTMRLTYTNVYG